MSMMNTPSMFNTISNFPNAPFGNGGGGSRIKVAVRVRPLLEGERQAGHECSRLRQQNGNEIM